MKTKSQIADSEISKEWWDTNMKVAMEGRIFYRTWMDFVRLKDLVRDLKELEEMDRRRAHAFQARVVARTVLPPEEQQKLFQKMAGHEQAVANRLALMRERLVEVLLA